MVAYTPQTWVNDAGGNTPVNATRLNHIEAGIVLLDTTKTTVKGEWVASPTAYLANDVVTHNGEMYWAAVAVPARATFTPGDWVKLSTKGANLAVLNIGEATTGVPDGSLVARWADISGGNITFPQGATGPAGPTGPPGPSGGGGSGGVALSKNLSEFTDLTGTWPANYSNDDKRLEKAFTWAKAQPCVGTVLVDYNAAFTGTHQAFEGMRLTAPPPFGGYHMAERSSGHLAKVVCTVTCGTGANSFLVGSSTLYGGYIAGIAWKAGGTNSQFMAWSAGTPFGWTLHNLAFVSFKHVLGNPTQKLPFTLANINGEWAINGPQPGSTQCTIGGSDNELWTDGCNIGAGGTETSATGEYLVRIDSLGKTNVGPMYFTADNGWRCMLLQGSSTFTHAFTLTGGRFEGRNAGDQSYGSLLKVAGSPSVSFLHWWFGYAMSAPGSYPTTDLGVIEVAGGDISFLACTYGRGNTATNSVPFIYQTGGHVAVWLLKTGGEVATSTPILAYTAGTRHTDGFSITPQAA